MKSTIRYSLALIVARIANAAHAQDKGCIELKTVAESEQEYMNEAGQKAKRLVPAEQSRSGR